MKQIRAAKIPTPDSTKRLSRAVTPERESSTSHTPDNVAQEIRQNGITPFNALAAQRLMGNRAVQRMIAASVQRKTDDHANGCSCGSCQRVQRQTVQRQAVRGGNTGVIQRHSSFEHKMLGDVDPSFLQIISSIDNIGRNDEARGREYTSVVDPNDPTKMVDDVQQKKIVATGGPYQGKVINSDMIRHVLDQEISRINYFKNQTSPKKKKGGAPSDVEAAKSYQTDIRDKDYDRQAEIQDQIDDQDDEAFVATIPNWDVRIIAVPSINNYEPLLVSYGEMNTLADIYGSTDELRAAKPDDRWKIVQGIRQQSLFRFMDMRNKIDGKSTNKPYIGQGFTGAYGNTGRGDNVGLPMGELSLIAKGKKGAEDKNSYSAGLARNACHFAPESWYAWADYHKKGLAKAIAGHTKNAQAVNAPNVPTKAALQEAAEQDLNDALLENGFGDHYLQDSYAAGHLINKTGVMQLFIRWMDEHPEKWDFMKDSTWRQMQNMSYRQPGIGHEAADDHYNVDNVGSDDFHAKDPQSVENTDGSWVKRFNASGLTVPVSLQPGTEEWNVTVWLQERAIGLLGSSTVTFAEVENKFNSTSLALKALRRLAIDGVIVVKGQSQEERGDMLKSKAISDKQIRKATFRIEDAYVPKDKLKFQTVVGEYRQTDDVTLKGKAENELLKAGAKISYASYHKMLKQSMVQLGTNVMHNKFCKEGLVVQTGSGESLGRIYGDDNMNNANSQQGVQYSSTTSHMSRQSIEQAYQTGVEPPAMTTQTIAQRFPTQIRVQGQYMSIKDWHNSEPFVKAMNEEFNTAGARVKSGFTEMMPEGKLSDDEGMLEKNAWDKMEVHQGDLF